MQNMQSMREIEQLLRQGDGFTLISHVSPDGDTLGSALALYIALKQLNKRVQVICEDAVPSIYAFMPCAGEVQSVENTPFFENAIAIDCADMLRMGRAITHFENAKATCNIDHHATNSSYARHNFVNANIAATGEIILMLLENLLQGQISKDIASCLYVAIMTDTGNFAYSNTTPDTLRASARLLECGVDNFELNRNVYRNVPYHKQRLLGIALNNMRLEFDGQVAITSVTQKEMQLVHATGEDSEGVIDYLRDIKDVEIAIMLREVAPNEYKGSLRSKTVADVGAIALKIGGGGHRNAAGCSYKGEFAAFESEVLRLAGMALEGKI